MDEYQDDSDVTAIRVLIGAHFDGMRWTPQTKPDWDTFSADFHPDAVLFPARRPAQARTLGQFIERMTGVAADTLHTFEEHTHGMKIHVFGNVAVVLAASELLENETEANHDVSAYLLVKDDGRWRIAAHAWDQASEKKPVPKDLL